MIEGNGSYSYKDGSKYNGEYKAGKRNGKGEYIFPDGKVYSGYFENNEFSGQGKLSDKTGKVLYEGKWKNSEPDNK